MCLIISRLVDLVPYILERVVSLATIYSFPTWLGDNNGKVGRLLHEFWFEEFSTSFLRWFHTFQLMDGGIFILIICVHSIIIHNYEKMKNFSLKSIQISK
jgi:hypothetical protein